MQGAEIRGSSGEFPLDAYGNIWRPFGSRFLSAREGKRLMPSLVCGGLNEGLQPDQFRFDAAQADHNFQISMTC